jgi:hypothetical protein
MLADAPDCVANFLMPGVSGGVDCGADSHLKVHSQQCTNRRRLLQVVLQKNLSALKDVLIHKERSTFDPSVYQDPAGQLPNRIFVKTLSFPPVRPFFMEAYKNKNVEEK